MKLKIVSLKILLLISTLGSSNGYEAESTLDSNKVVERDNFNSDILIEEGELLIAGGNLTFVPMALSDVATDSVSFIIVREAIAKSCIVNFRLDVTEGYKIRPSKHDLTGKSILAFSGSKRALLVNDDFMSMKSLGKDKFRQKVSEVLQIEGLNKINLDKARVGLLWKIDSLKLSKLLGKIDSLTDAEQIKFCSEFKEASNEALTSLNMNTSLINFWLANGNHIKGLVYPGNGHVDWDTIQVKQHIDINNINSLTIMRKLDSIQITNREVVGAVASATGSSSYFIGRNSKTFNTNTLSPILQERIDYLTLIKYDENYGGNLFKTLYTGVEKAKLHVAGDPGKHAEVIATDQVIKSGVVINQRDDLQSIKVLVRGKKFGHMCRCPHCFYILEKVNVLGSQD